MNFKNCVEQQVVYQHTASSSRISYNNIKYKRHVSKPQSCGVPCTEGFNKQSFRSSSSYTYCNMKAAFLAVCLMTISIQFIGSLCGYELSSDWEYDVQDGSTLGLTSKSVNESMTSPTLQSTKRLGYCVYFHMKASPTEKVSISLEPNQNQETKLVPGSKNSGYVGKSVFFSAPTKKSNLPKLRLYLEPYNIYAILLMYLTSGGFGSPPRQTTKQKYDIIHNSGYAPILEWQFILWDHCNLYKIPSCIGLPYPPNDAVAVP
ncbi:hypothetical protein GQR58_016196 [Nymphon striatum]|nr:hypothetical protein GQR58_016196 [Nymphon striatum]